MALGEATAALTRRSDVWFKILKFALGILDLSGHIERLSLYKKEGGQRMKGSAKYLIGTITAVLLAVWAVACTSVQEQPQPAVPAVAQQPAPARQEEAKKEEPKKQESTKAETKVTKTKAVEVEGVISSVGQRTITFQLERKGKVREEVVGVDDKTNIEKGGNTVKLRDLQETDKALINYEPDAYTPAKSVKVIGSGQIQKVGGDD
jgi:hypothetical protein